MKLDISKYYGNTDKYGEKIMEEAEKYLFTTKKRIDVFMYIEPMSGTCSHAKLFSASDVGKQNKLLFASYDLIWEADGTCRIFIGDLQMNQANVSNGYGTVFMDFILSLAKKNRATSISGLLGSSELLIPENKIRVLCFYKKYQFKIRMNEQQNSGEIYLDLCGAVPLNTSHI